MTSPDQSFINLCLHYLRDDYPIRIRECIKDLDREELNWRPNDRSNSISNLVCHLLGNARQWVYMGIGEFEYQRERDSEFELGKDLDFKHLDQMIEGLASDMTKSLTKLDAKTLDEKVIIQGFHVSKREALFHATEHFSMHTGQIIYITKMIKDQSLDFYSIADGKAKPRWKADGV